MTEDMIQEQELLFEDLGSTPDGAKTRAQLQSAHLMSGKIYDSTEISGGCICDSSLFDL